MMPLQNDLFDQFYTSLVEEPWQKANADAPFPWAAPQGLKDFWVSLIASPSAPPEQRTACAVGLSRSSRLSQSEKDVVEEFFVRGDFGSSHPDVIALLLVTGATPPDALWFGYFSHSATSSQDVFLFWILVGFVLRNPSCARLATSLLQSLNRTEPVDPLVSSQARLNCLVPFPSPPRPGTWANAVYQFHPLNRSPKPQDDLAHFAANLRWDWSHPSRANLLLPHPLYWIASARKGVSAFPSTSDLLHDPPLAMLQFFQGSSALHALWRYYNPLFNFPWDCPVIPQITHPALALAYLLVGHPPHAVWLHSLVDPNLEQFLSLHPCWPSNLSATAPVSHNPA